MTTLPKPNLIDYLAAIAVAKDAAEIRSLQAECKEALCLSDSHVEIVDAAANKRFCLLNEAACANRQPCFLVTS